MPDYVIFRAVVPPSFNLEEYAKRSSEPIRFDVVTVVEAEDEQEAINTLIGATGIIATGFAVCEVKSFGFGSKNLVGEGGKLRSPEKVKSLEESSDEKLRQIEKDIEALKKM